MVSSGRDRAADGPLPGQVPLPMVGEVVRRVLREHDGLLPPSMSAVEAAAAVRLERLAAGQGPGRCPEVRV